MIDILAANAEKTEQQGRPTADSVRAAREAGAFALDAVADATEVARTLTLMGRACPATSWIAGTCLTAKTLATMYGLTAGPDSLFCGTGAPTGRGDKDADGVRVNGRWVSVSGCEDADWAVLAVLVDGAFSLAQIPLADLSIDRTWDMAGMRGTGSHTLVADDVLVPADRVKAVTAPFGVGTMQLFAISVLAPMVGATFAALDVIDALFASDRKPYMTAYASMGESPGARQWLAEATALAQRAERTMLSVAAEVDTGTELTAADGSRLHFALSEAARDCRASLELLLDLHGTSGFRAANPLQRLWRDVAVGSRHPHLNAYLAVEGYGRTVAGVEA